MSECLSSRAPKKSSSEHLNQANVTIETLKKVMTSRHFPLSGGRLLGDFFLSVRESKSERSKSEK